MNDINLIISLPDVAAALNRIADALEKGHISTQAVQAMKETLESEVKPSKPKKEPKAEPAVSDPVASVKPIETVEKHVVIEDVRRMLASLSQSGKQAEVKQLIASFGAQKLTEIEPSQYAELLAKAEAL